VLLAHRVEERPYDSRLEESLQREICKYPGTRLTRVRRQNVGAKSSHIEEFCASGNIGAERCVFGMTASCALDESPNAHPSMTCLPPFSRSLPLRCLELFERATGSVLAGRPSHPKTLCVRPESGRPCFMTRPDSPIAATSLRNMPGAGDLRFRRKDPPTSACRVNQQEPISSTSNGVPPPPPRCASPNDEE